MTHAGLTTFVAHRFDDPRLAPAAWAELLAAPGAANDVFQTAPWQQIWWRHFGRGELLLVGVEHAGKLVALAPLFLDGGVLFFVGSGGSDYLDFLGDIAAPGVLDALLATARDAAPGFVGFLFYHLRETSPTARALGEAAARLGLVLFNEGETPAPLLEIAADPERARRIADKPSFTRHERALQREGVLVVEQARTSAAIGARLPAFFAQHIERWAATPHPSLFLDPVQRRFYENLAERADETGWLRFTQVWWNDEPVAAHFGFSHAGRFLYYKPSYALAHARRSPGQVMLRHTMLAALAEGAHTYDFGIGDEEYKHRFATCVPRVGNWSLYPPEVLAKNKPAP